MEMQSLIMLSKLDDNRLERLSHTNVSFAQCSFAAQKAFSGKKHQVHKVVAAAAAAQYVQQLTKAEEHGDNTMATSMQIKSSKRTAATATATAATVATAAFKPQFTFKTRLVSKMISRFKM